jgi:hypothetical protein
MLIPEVKFVDLTTFSPVEYIGCIDRSRIEQNCHLCRSLEGACVECGKCSKPLHVQCAIDNQFKLAFERQDGEMIPKVWCPEHTPDNDKLIELRERTATKKVSDDKKKVTP